MSRRSSKTSSQLSEKTTETCQWFFADDDESEVERFPGLLGNFASTTMPATSWEQASFDARSRSELQMAKGAQVEEDIDIEKDLQPFPTPSIEVEADFHKSHRGDVDNDNGFPFPYFKDFQYSYQFNCTPSSSSESLCKKRPISTLTPQQDCFSANKQKLKRKLSVTFDSKEEDHTTSKFTRSMKVESQEEFVNNDVNDDQEPTTAATQPRYSVFENQALIQAHFSVQLYQVLHGEQVMPELLRDLYTKNLKELNPNRTYPARESSALLRHLKALRAKHKNIIKLVSKDTVLGKSLTRLHQIVNMEIATKDGKLATTK